MTVNEMAKKLNIAPQSIRVAFQRGELSQFGCAYKSISGEHWRYLVNENAVNEFTKGTNTHEEIN